MSRMTAGSGDPSGDTAAYTYRPSLLGAPWEFRLEPNDIAWVTGRRSGRVPFRDVRRLRMSFKPGNMQSQCFITEIWAEGAPKLAIASASWKSMFQQERQDRAYVAFIAELHRRLAATAVPARF